LENTAMLLPSLKWEKKWRWTTITVERPQLKTRSGRGRMLRGLEANPAAKWLAGRKREANSKNKRWES